MDRKHMQRKKTGEGGDLGALSMLKSSFIGAACSIVVILVLALVFSAISYTRDDPDALLGVLSFAALYISALVAGIISAKRTKKSAICCGALSGMMLVGILFLVSLSFNDSYSSGYPWGTGMVIRASVVLLASLGGFIGIHKKNTRKRKRKRS